MNDINNYESQLDEVLNEDWISKNFVEIQILGYDEFNISPKSDWSQELQECFENGNKTLAEIWEKNHEYDDVTKHIKPDMKSILEENEIFEKSVMHIDEEYYNKAIKDISDCISERIAESYAKFFQCKPWWTDEENEIANNRKIWWKEDRIEDVFSRIIIMIHDSCLYGIFEDADEDKCIRYRIIEDGHYLSKSGIINRDVCIMECDSNGDLYRNHWISSKYI